MRIHVAGTLAIVCISTPVFSASKWLSEIVMLETAADLTEACLIHVKVEGPPAMFNEQCEKMIPLTKKAQKGLSAMIEGRAPPRDMERAIEAASRGRAALVSIRALID